MEKHIGTALDSPTGSRLAALLDRTRVAVLLVVVLGVLAVACTGAAVSTDAPPVNSEPAASSPSSIPIADTATSSVAAQPSAPVDDWPWLDADSIVAAQEEVIGGIYDRLVTSVVKIRSVRNLGIRGEPPVMPDIPGLPFDRRPDAPGFGDDFFERSGGTGFSWDDQGHIVTNHHVIEGADRVVVTFSNRMEVDAEVLGSDPDSDLAVLKVVVPDGMQFDPVLLGNSDEVRVGQMAAAIGNPFGQEFTITSGIISAIGRTIRSGNSQFSIPEVLQTDAPINPGNSGGPLLDRKGRVIGVNTQIISRSGASSGIGFAVPINIAQRVVPALISDGFYEYAWLGISGTTLSPDVAEQMGLPRDTRGTLVIDLTNDGPADAAGLHGSDQTVVLEGLDLPIGGDVIVGINGSPIVDMDGLISYLVSRTQPNEVAVLEVIRGNDREEISVTLGKRPS